MGGDGVIAGMYDTSGPLTVRTRTHELYTQPQVDFAGWMLERIPWRGDEVVVDVGCGAGFYIAPVCRQLARGGRLVAADLSMGMLRDVAAAPPPDGVALLAADATGLPLANGCCDVVLANHVLYHVPEIRRAVAEIHRVLRVGGCVVAATNAADSMERFVDEIQAAGRTLGRTVDIPSSPLRLRFTLENGVAFFDTLFARVERHVLPSELVFDTATPAVAYVDSLRHAYEPLLPADLAWEGLMAQVERQIEAHIVSDGAYRVAKTTGVFVAVR